MKSNNNCLQFPIIYNEHHLEHALYSNAFTRLKNKFNRSDKETTRLLHDIIKSMVVNNEPPETLFKLIESLCVPTWSFLRDQDINEVLIGIRR